MEDSTAAGTSGGRGLTSGNSAYRGDADSIAGGSLASELGDADDAEAGRE
jgi:hypothetical protein